MDLGTLGELKDRLCLSGIGKPVLVGIAAVIALVAVVAAVRLAGTADAGVFEVSKAAADAEQPASAEPDAGPATLFVHVSGAVRAPGLYEVDGGARVADAVNAAGGFADDAETGSVNLARPLEDGEQIAVAAQGAEAPAAGGAGTGAAAGASASGASASGASASGLVNINTADAVELVSLPGIGEATAAKIIADREANGPFSSVDDLKRVSGVGDKKLEALAGLICV